MMNPRGYTPSSFFSEEVCLSDERQAGVSKMDHMTSYNGLKLERNFRTEGGMASSPLESRIPQGFALPEYYLSQGRKHIIGAERAASCSLPSTVDHGFSSKTNSKMESVPFFFDGSKMNLMGSQYENGLFSSSMSDLFNRNLKLSTINAQHGHSQYDDEEAFESLEELEAHAIGNLLPDDDDDLLSGVTDGFSSIIKPANVEDVDLFNSVGGLELGEDDFTQSNPDVNSKNKPRISAGSNGEHPLGKHPSRTLFVRNINSNVEDSELRTLFEQYGDIRTLYTSCKHRGFVMISYYDIRAASDAMKALQNKPLRRRKLDIHFSIPKETPSDKDINQGTLVIFNLDSSFSNDELREIFSVYGEIREISDTPNKSHHKFIEFYDIRAAESAFLAVNRNEIGGKQIMIAPGQSVDSKRFMQSFSLELEQEEAGFLFQQHNPSNLASGFSGSISLGGTLTSTDNETIMGHLSTSGFPVSPLLDSALHHGASSSVPNSLSSRVRVESGNTRKYQQLQGMQNFHPHSLPECHDGLPNGHPLGTPTGQPINGTIWGNSHHPQQDQTVLWAKSPSFGNGMRAVPSRMVNSLVNHHVGSAPSVNNFIWDTPNNPASLGNMRMSSPHSSEFISHNIFPNCMDVPLPTKNIGLHPHHQRCIIFPARGQMLPVMGGSFDSPNERSRNRRNEGSSSQPDNKKQFELDLERILRGDDNRTTLMIKNIPNKYTSKMLLAAIDERHRGTYDFIYLPIDFKNKCNVGYAFINMTDPSLIVPFYQTFDGKKWEKFNSEKVASIAYARIQGKAALIAHFQNSSLMNEDKRCRPILFNTDGPNAGDQVPFPMGPNIRSRPGKTRTNTSEENGEDYSNGESSSSSGKDSD